SETLHSAPPLIEPTTRRAAALPSREACFGITVLYNGDGDFLASTSAVLTQTVLSAAQQTTLLVNQVNALVTSGVLSSNDANGLTAKLNAAKSEPRRRQGQPG